MRRLNKMNFGTKLLNKNKPSTKTKPGKTLIRKINPTPASSNNTKNRAALKGGVGYREYSGDNMWLPNTVRPFWLDGTLPGDRGFDPLCLSKPVNYLQFGIDQLDQNQAVNKSGSVISEIVAKPDEISSGTLEPYSDVFGIIRMRECELIHGRWAMLATLGIIVAETSTGASWVDAGKIELEGSQYLNFNIPINISQLCYIEALAMGGAEVYRNSSKDKYKRLYPGGFFDFANLASYGVTSEKQIIRLRESEIKHCRLAMIAFLGLSVQALYNGNGAIGSLANFAN